MDTEQVYNSFSTNPNDPLIAPKTPQIVNLYLSQTDDSNWRWDVSLQQWIKLSPANQISQGTGNPSTPPSNINLPALYTDLSTGNLFTWNASTRTWV